MSHFVILLIFCILMSHQASTKFVRVDPTKPGLIFEPGTERKCYFQKPLLRTCSVFPFKTSFNKHEDQLTSHTINLIYNENCTAINKTNKYVPYVFQCYVSLGICNTKKWGVPKNPSLESFLEMLKTQKFLNLNDDLTSNKPAMCKKTCEEALYLYNACEQKGSLDNLEDKNKICSNLPDTNCIDNQRMKEYLEKSSTITLNMHDFHKLNAFLVLFLGLSIISMLF